MAFVEYIADSSPLYIARDDFALTKLEINGVTGQQVLSKGFLFPCVHSLQLCYQFQMQLMKQEIIFPISNHLLPVESRS